METKTRLKGSQVKCKGCGGNLKFDPSLQKLSCQHCGNSQDFEVVKEYSKHNLSDKPSSYENYKSWMKNNKVMRCDNCGGEIVLNALEYASSCPYCESPLVSETSTLPSIVPDSIIPFQFDERTAESKFIDNVKKKFFVPSKFKKLKTQKVIRPLYFPAFSFDAHTISNYSGALIKETVTSDGQGNRSTSYERFSISGIKDLQFDNLIIESSSKLSQKQIAGILPYDITQAVKFNENFLKGYTVEHFADALEKCYEDAKNAMKNTIRNSILSGYDYTRIESLTINTAFNYEKYAYRVLPIYKFQYDYKNKPFVTYMNGQNGKVGGGLPISGLKVALVVLLLILFIGVPIVLCFLSELGM